MLFSRNPACCFAILLMGLRGEREGLPSSMLPTSFAEVAGVAGRQNWVLCCRVAHWFPRLDIKQVGVRFPELVTFHGTN